MSSANKISLVSGCLMVLVQACGGSEPAPRTRADVDDEPVQHERKQSLSMGGEIGALDEKETDEVFSSLVPELERCLHSGAKRVEFLGGAVSFFVKVDSGGTASHAHLEKSSLGDRETEKCMLSAIQGKDWPRPVGGDAGYARKSFDFDPPNDVRPPTEWSGERANDTIDTLASKIKECKNGTRGRFTATLYVATDGSVLSAGVTPPDEDGEASVDCLVGILRDAKLPSPGSWPAKVSFEI
jgi:hypothetical protein